MLNVELSLAMIFFLLIIELFLLSVTIPSKKTTASGKNNNCLIVHQCYFLQFHVEHIFQFFHKACKQSTTTECLHKHPTPKKQNKEKKKKKSKLQGHF